MSIERLAEVKSLAHQLWIARGKPEGSPEIDWREAERLLDAGASNDNAESAIVGNSLSRSSAGSDGAISGRGDRPDLPLDASLADDEATQVNPDLNGKSSTLRPRKR
jgi:hypothetical protein